MDNNAELFDNETILYISELVESHSYKLNDIKDFKEKDTELSNCIENLEKLLSKEQKEKFDEVVRTLYQVDEYYLALAYAMGTKFGMTVSKV